MNGGELNFVVYCESSFELLVECRAELLLLTLLPHGVGVDTAGGSMVTGGQDETQQVAVQFLIIVGMATGNLLSEDPLGVLDWADAVHEHWLPDGPVVLVELDNLRDDAEHRLGDLLCLVGVGLEVH